MTVHLQTRSDRPHVQVVHVGHARISSVPNSFWRRFILEHHSCGVSKLAFRLQNGDFARRNRVLTPPHECPAELERSAFGSRLETMLV
jgi:hypothetical protein